eukprot:gb/GECG01007244.1/.p1 GENE.gb/GECG01007244.1/~~gb/GECG01007244.1/.p1  ORF type:complete len:176 (+),score=22.38 gb/GECG01007244.1/:1-528(+)
MQYDGGFIVQQKQKFFMIDWCTSSGGIAGILGGGIRGYQCGHDSGQIKISNSYSTGNITGASSGGIAGPRVGNTHGIVNISNCHSSGNMGGDFAEGICGEGAALTNGQVYIFQSYPTGNIIGSAKGGIVSSNRYFHFSYNAKLVTQMGSCTSKNVIALAKSRPSLVRELLGELQH